MKFGFKKRETLLYRVVQNVFQYLEPFRRGHECGGQTDGQTDGLLSAIAQSTDPR